MLRMTENQIRLFCMESICIVFSFLIGYLFLIRKRHQLGDLCFEIDNSSYFKSDLFYCFRVFVFLLLPFYLIYTRAKEKYLPMDVLLCFLSLLPSLFSRKLYLKRQTLGLYENGFCSIDGIDSYSNCQCFAFKKEGNGFCIVFKRKPAFLKMEKRLFIDSNQKKEEYRFLSRKLTLEE